MKASKLRVWDIRKTWSQVLDKLARHAWKSAPRGDFDSTIRAGWGRPITQTRDKWQNTLIIYAKIWMEDSQRGAGIFPRGAKRCIRLETKRRWTFWRTFHTSGGVNAFMWRAQQNQIMKAVPFQDREGKWWGQSYSGVGWREKEQLVDGPLSPSPPSLRLCVPSTLCDATGSSRFPFTPTRIPGTGNGFQLATNLFKTFDRMLQNIFGFPICEFPREGSNNQRCWKVKFTEGAGSTLFSRKWPPSLLEIDFKLTNIQICFRSCISVYEVAFFCKNNLQKLQKKICYENWKVHIFKLQNCSFQVSTKHFASFIVFLYFVTVQNASPSKTVQ